MRNPPDPSSAGDNSRRKQEGVGRRNWRYDNPALDLAAYVGRRRRDTEYAPHRNPQTQRRLRPLLARALRFAPICLLVGCALYVASWNPEFNLPAVIIAGFFIGPAILIAPVLILRRLDREREAHSRPACTCPACTKAEQRRRDAEWAAKKSAKAKDTGSLFDEL